MSNKFRSKIVLIWNLAVYKKLKEKYDMKKIEEQIKELKSKLTGNLLEDGEIQMEIYELKKQLNPHIEENPEEDTDNFCLNCGS